MAKMFYTLQEVCTKLEKSEAQVKDMVKSGQIQEFRDRDKLMFKKEQIDLLVGSGEDDNTGDLQLQLEDSSLGGSGAGLSGSGLNLKDESSIGLSDSREGTGISVFDTGHGGEEASGETHVGEPAEELSLESVGSGSGLLDLTRESDDTSLGAELIEEVYANPKDVEIPAHASGLFEATGAESSGNMVGEGSAMPVLIEAYDGSGSGLGVGLMIGALVALICVAIVGIVGVGGATSGLATTFAGNLWVWFGGLLGVTIIFGLVGLFVGKASE